MNPEQVASAALNSLDFVVVAGSILALLAIAYFTGKEEKDTNDFFLGARRIPWWAACLSFVATEISAATVVGVPARSFDENWQWLQFFIGSASARIAIAFLFIPVFYRYSCTTIYQFLRYRFSPNTQYTTSIFFFVTRLLGSGVRLYAASLGVAVILGWSLFDAVLLFTLVSIVFIAFGGIKAVVWTNVLQALTFIVGGVATLGFLYWSIHGGFPEIWRVASEGEPIVTGAGQQIARPGNHLSLFNLKWDFRDPTILWIAILNGFFGSMASFGTDHDLMQRLLTVKTRKASQRTLVLTIGAILPIDVLFLAIGTLLFVFYRQNTGLALPDNADKILSHFVTHVMPNGLKGLLLAAIIMASIDSPLGSLSASFVTDIYRTLMVKGRGERHYLFISRVSVVAFGIILALLALIASYFEGLLWVAFKINGVTACSMLGVFLLGILTRRKINRANILGMLLSSETMAGLLVLSELPALVRPEVVGRYQWTAVAITVGALAVTAAGFCLADRRRMRSQFRWSRPAGILLATAVMTAGIVLAQWYDLVPAWSWLIVIGTMTTFVLGYVLGPVLDYSAVSAAEAPAEGPVPLEDTV